MGRPQRKPGASLGVVAGPRPQSGRACLRSSGLDSWPGRVCTHHPPPRGACREGQHAASRCLHLGARRHCCPEALPPPPRDLTPPRAGPPNRAERLLLPWGQEGLRREARRRSWSTRKGCPAPWKPAGLVAAEGLGADVGVGQGLGGELLPPHRGGRSRRPREKRAR